MIDLLITVLILCVVGGLVWAIVTRLPIPEPFKNIALIVVLLIFLLVILSMFTGGPAYFHFPRS